MLSKTIISLWFCYPVVEVDGVFDTATKDLFGKMQSSQHCLSGILPIPHISPQTV